MNHMHNKARLGVLDGLIKYMRKLELGKDQDGDPLEKGMDHVEHKMDMEHKPKMEMEIEIEGRPGEAMERDHDSREMRGPDVDNEEEDESEEMSPLHKEMGNFFNDRDRPKVGNGMSFMDDMKPRMGKEKMMEMKEKGRGAHLTRKRGRKKKMREMA